MKFSFTKIFKLGGIFETRIHKGSQKTCDSQPLGQTPVFLASCVNAIV